MKTKLLDQFYLRHLTFFVTTACNAKCSFCCYPRVRSKRIKTLSNNEVDLITTHLQWLETVSLTGGEPFLRDDFSKILISFGKIGTLKEVTVSTNGTAVDQCIAAATTFLEKCGTILRIKVSIDGPAVYHDHVRGLPGSYEKAFNCVRSLLKLALTERRLFVHTTTLVSIKNIKWAAEFTKFLRSALDPHVVEILPMRGESMSISERKAFERYYENTARIVLNECYHRENNAICRENTDLGRMVADEIRYVLKTGQLRERCHAGTSHVVLEPDGEIRICEYITEQKELLLKQNINNKEFNLGNVRNYGYDLNSSLSTKKAEKLRRAITRCSCLVPCVLRMNIWEHQRSEGKSDET